MSQSGRIPAVDNYIINAQPFAQPILIRLRDLTHSSHPQIQEVIKWGMPHFEYKGNLCAFASFKKHCAFMFWKASIMDDPHGFLKPVGSSGAMGNMGKIQSNDDLPSDEILLDFLAQAIDLNERNVPLPKKTKAVVVPDMPDDFLDALQEEMTVFETFEAMAPSHRKEYLEWIMDAKRPETRARRIATAVEWISQGKGRNWKYEK